MKRKQFLFLIQSRSLGTGMWTMAGNVSETAIVVSKTVQCYGAGATTFAGSRRNRRLQLRLQRRKLLDSICAIILEFNRLLNWSKGIVATQYPLKNIETLRKISNLSQLRFEFSYSSLRCGCVCVLYERGVVQGQEGVGGTVARWPKILQNNSVSL